MKYFVLFILIIFIYSAFVEPNILTVKRFSIKDNSLEGLKLVFASDFHFKTYEKYRLNKIVKTINKENPDIILMGGDYVNGHKKGNTLPINVIAEGFANLQSTYGTVAIMGNHDGWQGKREIIREFEKNGITVLENNSKDFGKFSIAGIQDLQTGTPDVAQALKNVTKPVILLTHTPDMIKDVPSYVNLTLAGHTHGGQVVLPFAGALIVPSNYGKKYSYGWIPYKKLYVTNGLGTSILPLRFNCIPEIVVIEFIKN